MTCARSDALTVREIDTGVQAEAAAQARTNIEIVDWEKEESSLDQKSGSHSSTVSLH